VREIFTSGIFLSLNQITFTKGEAISCKTFVLMTKLVRCIEEDQKIRPNRSLGGLQTSQVERSHQRYTSSTQLRLARFHMIFLNTEAPNEEIAAKAFLDQLQFGAFRQRVGSPSHTKTCIVELAKEVQG